MKADRFVKIMLVVIAGLLFLNCFKGDGGKTISIPFLESSTVKAAPPAFIQVGKFYEFQLGILVVDGRVRGKVEKIDENGWLYIQHYSNDKWEGHSWLNINRVLSCFEDDMPKGTANSNSNSNR